MSNIVAIVKSLVGQVFAISVEGLKRQIFEGERLLQGEQVMTGLGGEVTLQMANGELVNLGESNTWQAGNAEAEETDSAPDASLEQALAAGFDPTIDLEAPAAGPGATGGAGGAAGGGHSFVLLDETGQQLEATIGFTTSGLELGGGVDDELPSTDDTAAIDTTAPVVTISIDAITGDDLLSSPELAGGLVAVTGTVGGDAAVGDRITLTIGGTVYNGSVIQRPDGSLGFSIDVASDDLRSGSTLSVTLTSIDAAGNSGSATLTHDYTLNTPPALSVDNASINLPENGLAGPIANATVVDIDGDIPTFSLVGSVPVNGSGEPLFSIDGVTGVISLTAAGAAFIDYESGITSYALSVQATAGGDASNIETITVNLSNVNDNAPVITVTAVPVTENAVAVGTVVASFVASDADGDSLTYSLLNNADGYFALDGTNVVLTQAGVDAINDDALNLADLTISVQADDGSFQTSDSDISAITRINDNAPVITVTAVPVTEGSVALGDVIASFVASDADGDTLSYNLLNNADGYFALDGTNVVLTQAGVDAINDDALNLADLTISVQADDGSFQTSDSDISAITRINDNAPVITVTAVPVTEGSVALGDVIASFVASDADGDTLSYSLLNNADGYFALDGTNVVLTQAGVDAINDDALNLADLTISVQADDGSFQTSDSDISAITRINDNAPVITVTAVPVTEGSVALGDVIASFVASDADGDTLSYSLLNNADGYFALDGTNVILTQAGVDAINDDVLSLSDLTISVQADDGANQTSDSDVSAITRINDNAPVITVTAVPVTEGSVALGDVIASFVASDADGDSLSYSLLNNADGYFALDGTNVVLTQAGVDAINDDALNLADLTISVQADDGSFQTSDSDISAITRINDNAPVITVTAVPVTEGSVALGDVIASFVASDADGDTLSYSLLNNADGYFALDGTNVVLTQAGVDAINDDVLSLNDLTISVQADDGSFQTSDSDISAITRINDNAPVITVTAVPVTEGSVALGDVIASFVASDADGDTLSYSLLNNADGYFALDGTNVVLTQAGVDAINDDVLSLNDLTISVQADDGANQTSDSDVSAITRINDNAPVITVTAVPVTENAVTAGDVIASFVASDADGDTLSYSLLNNADGYFALDGTNVVLTQAGVDAINDDALNLADLTISVQTDDGANQTSDSDISAITRINDNAPVITVTAVPVTEGSVTLGDVIASFVASDADGDSLTYSLLNNADGYFALDGTNVVLTQAGVDAINDDVLSLNDLTISVQADDGSFQTSDSDVSAITRINDNAPVITVTAVPVTEGSVALGDVIASFVASDADGDSLTYSLLNNADGYFALDGTNVVLTQAGVDAINDDVLNLSDLTISVQADDGANQTSDSDVSAITRINDNAPVITVTAVPVTEGSVALGDVIASFVASDADGDSLTYSLLNNADGYFALDGTNVVLTQAGVDAINDDVLNLSDLTISVQADDGANQTSDSDISAITRINDNAPVITVTAVPVTEGSVALGDVIASFVASDADGDSLSYSLLNNADGYFALDGTNVVLTQAGVDAINDDALNLADLTISVQADDGANQTSDSDISAITRINDNAPVITVTAVPVTENAVSAGDAIASFVASDADGDTLSYSLLNNADGYFALDGTNVVLTQAGVDAINDDALNLADLTISVQTDDGANQTSDSDISAITRINDNAPVITVTAVPVTENAVSAGDAIASFVASDADGDTLSYSLLNNANGYFALDGTNVVLTQAGVDAINDDALSLSDLTISVQADDGANQTSDSDVSAITRINDNAPVITVTAVPVTEGSVALGDVIASFVASDADGDSLTYSLLNNAEGYFALDGTNVVLTQAGVDAINNDALNLADLTISVQADDGSFQTSDSDISAITRINDNAPVITVTAVPVTEGSVALGDVIASFVASDADGDTLSYSLLNNADGYFALDGTNVVLTQAGVDAINDDVLSLSDLTISVQADDGANQTSDSDVSAITRINDNAPVITVTAVPVTEGSVALGDVIASFVASDADGDTLSYSLLNNADGYFALDGTNVVLTQAGVDAINDDVLSLNDLTISVQADDGANQTSDSDVSAITRINDNAPVITVTAVPVTEGSVALGDVIASFVASDADGDSLSYSLLNNAEGYFALDGTNVVLTQAGVDAINDDVLSLSDLTISVQADDGANQTSDSDVSAITRINDNAPVITVTAVPVTEGSVALGDVIASFVASDADGDTLSYSLLNNADGYFALDGTNVVLTQAGVDAINDDALNLADLTISVQADDGANQTSDSDVSAITRINDNAPVITVTAVPVTEGSVALGDVIASFVASDADGDSLTYSLLNNADGYFALDGTNVVLTQAGVDAINDDVLNLSDLTISVQADDGSFQTSDSDISAITRINDNAPVITVTAVPVTEGSVALGDVIASFVASDADGDTLSYSLLNNADGYFALDGTNVVLTQAGVDAINDDVLNLSDLTISVQADDGANQTSDSDVSAITRINDNAPVITVTAAPALLENSAAAGDVVATFTASDVEDGPPAVDFTPGSNADGYYTLDGNNVVLTSDGAAFVQAGGTLPAVDLTATDSDSLTASDSDTPSVTAQNDAPVITVTAAPALPENSAAAGDVVATFTASDEEDGTPAVDFTPGSNADGYYALDGNNVVLTTDGAAFVQAGGTLPAVDLTATDSDSLTASDSDTPTVTAQNDAPVITVTAAPALLENSAAVGDVVATFTASDEEDGTPAVDFTPGSNADGYYALDGNNVVLTSDGAAFVQAGGTLPAVDLTATDSGSLTASDSDTPSVTAQNDAPVITVTAAPALLENSAAAGDVVATFTASDEEDGTPAVDFTPGSNADGYYALDGNNVVLTTDGAAFVQAGGTLPAVDLTATDSDSLTAGDSDTPSVTAQNDAPVITVTAAPALLENSASVGDVVATFTASDEEDGTPAVDFTPGSNADGYYALDGNNVVLTSDGAAFVQAGGTLPAVDLTATDSGSLTASDSDIPTVTAQNDAPVITVTAAPALLENSAAVGDVVATFTASDEEDGTPAVDFTPGSNADGYYALDGSNVVLTTDGAAFVQAGGTLPAVDLTATDSGSLTASDSDTPSVTAQNDAPVITVTAAPALLENSAAVGAVVATFTASDEEDGTPAVDFTPGSNADGYYALDGNNVVLTSDGAAFVQAGGTLPAVDLTATDSGSLTASDSDTPSVTAQNDAPTIVVTANDFAENSAVAGAVAATYSVNDEEDADADLSVDFTAGSNADGYYALAAGQVVLTPDGAAFVNGGGTLPAVDLTVTDLGGLTGTDSDTPLTTGNNDAPVITVTAAPALLENSAAVGDVVATFTASDEEDGTPAVDFTPGSNADGYYALDGNNVVLTSDGAAFVQAGGTLPAVDLTATDSGSLTASDSDTPTVTAQNDAPLAVNDGPVAVAEDTAATGNVLDNDSDQENDALSVTQFTVAGDATVYSAGSTAIIAGVGSLLINANGSFTFTPAANYIGPVPTATYTVTDGGLTDTAELSFADVTPVNDAPTGSDGVISLNEDNSYSFSADDFGFADIDSGDSLQAVRIDSLPGAGSLQLNGAAVSAGQVIALADLGNLTFQPAPDASGTNYTNLTFSVSDQAGQFAATPNTVTFDVTPVADAPIVTVSLGAASISTTTINTANVTTSGQGFTVSTIDLNGNPGGISINGSPAGFGVTGAASGADSEIGELNGQAERIVVDFDAPVASVDVRFAWLHSGERATYTLFDSDGNTIGSGTIAGFTDAVDPAITLTSSSGAAISRVEFSVPTNNASAGDDYLINSIEFAASTSYPLTITATPSDIDHSESIASITVAVPTGATLSAGTDNGNGTWTLPLSGSGSYSVVVDPTTQGLTITGLSMTIPGNPVGNLSVTVTATAQDGTDTNSSSSSITIGDIGAPETANVSVVANEDSGPVSITLSATDDASSIANFTITSLPTNGTLIYNGQEVLIGQAIPAIGNQANLNFMPNTNWNGSTDFQYLSSDVAGNVDQTSATVSILINALNDAPVNQLPASYTTNEDIALKLSGLSVSDADIASGLVSVTLAVASGTLSAATANGVTVSGAGTGTLTLSGTLADINAYLAAPVTQPSYQPVANASGNVTLTMTSNDGGNTGAGGVLTDVDTRVITINPVADAVPGSDVSVVIGTPVTNEISFTSDGGLTGKSEYTFGNGVTISTGGNGTFNWSSGNNLGVNGAGDNGTEAQRIEDNESINFSFPTGMQYLALKLKNSADDIVKISNSLETADLAGKSTLSGTITTSSTATISSTNLKVELQLEVTNAGVTSTVTRVATVNSGGTWSVSLTGLTGTITKATLNATLDGGLFNQGGNESANVTYSINADMSSLSIGLGAANAFGTNAKNNGFQIEYIAVDPNPTGLTSFSYPIDVFAAVQDTVGTPEAVTSLTLSDLPAGSSINVVLADGSYQEINANAQGVFDLSAYTSLLTTPTATSGTDKIYLVTSSALPSGFAPTLALEINDGGNTAKTIIGGSANSTFVGDNGNDYISGGAGIDSINGGAGNDTLDGGVGNDILIGGEGDDILFGGTGADSFVWQASHSGNDAIKDFSTGEGDRIDLRDLLQGENDGNILNYLRVDTLTSTLEISTTGQFNAGGSADVTIKLENGGVAVDLSSYGATSSDIVNSLIAGADPLVKVDHT